MLGSKGAEASTSRKPGSARVPSKEQVTATFSRDDTSTDELVSRNQLKNKPGSRDRIMILCAVAANARPVTRSDTAPLVHAAAILTNPSC